MESHFWDVAEIRWELLAMQWQVLQAQTEAIQNFTHCGWPKHCASACEADILGNPGLGPKNNHVQFNGYLIT